ncbi:MAG: cupin domain-containing protein [Chloroflexota bacterium]|nr:cupin domain-containing protein [Chloroflexota bacterium]
MEPVRNIEELKWQPHPTAKGVRIKVLVSQGAQGTDLTCMLVQIGRGLEVTEHVHDHSDDILYPLSGKARMWVDGSGEFSLEPGVIVRVPQGTRHRIFDVSEDLLLYDVFWPALL